MRSDPIMDEPTPIPKATQPAQQKIVGTNLSPHELVTIQKEVFLGLPPSLTTPEALAFREATLQDIAETKKRGLPKLVLSPHDHIQAVKHHPEFQRCLAVWRDILRKEAEGIALTDEEEAMKWAPRSHFNVEAELEATRYGLLSLAERELSSMGEEKLAWRDCSPQLDWVNRTAILRIPLDMPQERIEDTVADIVRRYKTRLGITPSQRVRRPQQVDPWQVYRWHHDDGVTLLAITQRLFGTSGSTAYDPEVKRRYEQVRRAYQFALDAMDRIGKDYA